MAGCADWTTIVLRTPAFALGAARRAHAGLGDNSRLAGREAVLPAPADLPAMNSFAPVTTYPALTCAALLTASNLFMTFAWYGHLKHLQASPWWTAALVSWGIALFEYLLQVPANRVGYTTLSLAQLKILQEAITLTVFVPFSIMYMDQPIKLDFLWAGLCLLGAVYFTFRA
jgi:uncharacterized protein (DUF486 family)